MMDWNRMTQNLEKIFEFFLWWQSKHSNVEERPYFNHMFRACDEMREAIQKEDYRALTRVWEYVERAFSDSGPYDDEVLHKWHRLKRF
jgi:hypothetical protein